MVSVSFSASISPVSSSSSSIDTQILENNSAENISFAIERRHAFANSLLRVGRSGLGGFGTSSSFVSLKESSVPSLADSSSSSSDTVSNYSFHNKYSTSYSLFGIERGIKKHNLRVKSDYPTCLDRAMLSEQWCIVRAIKSQISDSHLPKTNINNNKSWIYRGLLVMMKPWTTLVTFATSRLLQISHIRHILPIDYSFRSLWTAFIPTLIAAQVSEILFAASEWSLSVPYSYAVNYLIYSLLSPLRWSLILYRCQEPYSINFCTLSFILSNVINAWFTRPHVAGVVLALTSVRFSLHFLFERMNFWRLPLGRLQHFSNEEYPMLEMAEKEPDAIMEYAELVLDYLLVTMETICLAPIDSYITLLLNALYRGQSLSSVKFTLLLPNRVYYWLLVDCALSWTLAEISGILCYLKHSRRYLEEEEQKHQQHFELLSDTAILKSH